MSGKGRGTASKAKTPARKNGGPVIEEPIEEPSPVTEPVTDESGAVDILMRDRSILEPIYEQVDIRQRELAITTQQIQQLQVTLTEGVGQQQHLAGMMSGFEEIVSAMLTKILKDYGLEPGDYEIDRKTWKLVKKVAVA